METRSCVCLENASPAIRWYIKRRVISLLKKYGRDAVCSRDADTGETGFKEVEEVFQTGAHTIYRIEMDGTACITRILKERYEEPVPVFNLHVKDWVSFFVSRMRIYVHNGIESHSQGSNETVTRPSWRQSELDAAKDFLEYAEQKSFINGEEVPYGTKGSVRPDLCKNGSSIDVKNYKVETVSGRDNLARNIEKQYYQRMNNLPEGTKQSVLIDIRGQNVSDTELSSLYNDIVNRTNNGTTIKFKTK